jgi:hypothetical protein
MSDERPHAVPPLTTQVVSRRAHIRIDVLGQIEAHSVWRLMPIRLREIGEAGFSIEATAPFEVDHDYKFRVGIENSGRSIIVRAQARHCTLVSVSAALPIYVAGFVLIDATEAIRREMRALVRFAESLWQADDDTTAMA